MATLSGAAYDRAMRPLTARLDDDSRRPWFLWDEDTSLGELKAALQVPGDERDRLLAKLLREANDREVWRFVTPQEVADALPRLARRIGRRRAPFWTFLIGKWREQGYVR